MKRIYIAGCGGMLGEAFYHTFREEFALRCTDIDTNEPWLHFTDIRDRAAYCKDVQLWNPDYLFHLGALTDLEYCEQHPADAYSTNTLAVENAVHIANDLGIPLLYISTAGIFDGREEVYDDWAAPNPLGVYARSKYQGERFVVDNMTRYLVCRAGWMMGGGPRKDKKFVQKLMAQIREGRRELFVVNDKDGTPTYTFDFAANVKELVETRLWGVYNMVCGGRASRLEVAREILDALNLRDRIRLMPVPSEHFSVEYFAPRPPCERLVNAKLQLRNLDRMSDWRSALRTYLATQYEYYLSHEES